MKLCVRFGFCGKDYGLDFVESIKMVGQRLFLDNGRQIAIKLVTKRLQVFIACLQN